MTKLTVVASFKVKADKMELVKAELDKMVEHTRIEEGCINYDLHQDNDNPEHFLFYENWTSRELWQAHIASQHVQAYRSATQGAIEDFVVYEMTQVA